MSLIFHILCGFTVAFLGVLPPGLLNMTAAKISGQHGRRRAAMFAAGASVTVIAQVYVAVVFAKYLSAHPEVIALLNRIAFGIFIVLAVFFFVRARSGGGLIEGKDMPGKMNLFLRGLFLSLLNVFPIPFYLGFTAFLSSKEMFVYQAPEAYGFIMAAAVGTFAMLWIYIHYTDKYQLGSERFNRNINYALSAFLMAIAVFTAIKLWA